MNAAYYDGDRTLPIQYRKYHGRTVNVTTLHTQLVVNVYGHGERRWMALATRLPGLWFV